MQTGVRRWHALISMGLISWGLLSIAAKAATGTIEVSKLRCEYLSDPISIDTTSPRFSWILSAIGRGRTQKGYRILVASSEQALQADTGDAWDTGEVLSDRSVNVPYSGRPLISGEKLYWKVKVWDQGGVPSSWSAPATFEMGLLHPSDWHGEWIGAGQPTDAAPLLRKTFQVSGAVKRSRVYISGLGWYELYLNGQRVGDHVLDPAFTDYSRRILYATYDVTSLLKPGTNTIGVILGNGWFSQPTCCRGGPLKSTTFRFGTAPQLLFQMDTQSSQGDSWSVVSDESWRTHDSAILFNNLQGNETYDARREIRGWNRSKYDDSTWAQAVKVKGPGGMLVSQMMPPIKVIETLLPAKLTNPKPGVYIYDFGRTISGWARLRVNGPRGTTVSLEYSERIYPDTGLLDMRNHPPPAETDHYTLKGSSTDEIYEPTFTFHLFRYVQVDGYPGSPAATNLEAQAVHSAVDDSPLFDSSNPLMNQIHQIAFWTIANSLYGMPMDEPYREPYTYLEPGETPANLFSRRFMPQIWTNWLADVQDAQSDDGSIPTIIPTYLWKPPKKPLSDASWSGQYPIAVWYLYRYYGDDRLLAEHYSSMQRWVDYLTSIAAPDHSIASTMFGDHMQPGIEPGEEQIMTTETPYSLCSTAFYYRDVWIMSQIAGVLKRPRDADRYRRLASEIKDTFNEKWFDPTTDQYASGSETSNLLPLVMGIVPAAHRKDVAKNVIDSMKGRYGGHLHTGIIGTTAAMDALASNGYADVLYDAINRTTYPGWGYELQQGSTTIWENWGRMSEKMRGYRAENMTMFATIDEFMYRQLAGIEGPSLWSPEFVAPGFRELHFHPYIPSGLRYANASFETVRGRVTSGWERNNDGFHFGVSVPVNSTARVDVPELLSAKTGSSAVIRESGEIVWQDGHFVPAVPGIVKGTEIDGYVSFSVGSGTYDFYLKEQ